MPNINILKAGLLTTIQDLGRIGYGQYGIPPSGAMDKLSLEVANILVGNSNNEGCLEFTMLPPTLVFNDDRQFAITGGDFQPHINNKPINMYQCHRAFSGDILSFKGHRWGCRGYIAIAGGFDIPLVMGSKSTYLRGGFGGFNGRRLKDGDILDLNKPPLRSSTYKISEDLLPDYNSNNIIIRVIPGPEEAAFTKEGIDTFYNSQYQLTNQSDRMGFRFEGPPITHINGADIISGGINLGAIQVPGEGKPIIMMADHQTTGGYTKIANVISVDIPRVAQLRPGDSITFRAVTIDEAQRLLIQQRNSIKELKVISLKKRERIFYKNYNISVNGRNYKVDVEEFKD